MYSIILTAPIWCLPDPCSFLTIPRLWVFFFLFSSVQFLLLPYAVLLGWRPALECFWPTKGHNIKEGGLFYAPQLVVGFHSLLSPCMLGFCLVWVVQVLDTQSQALCVYLCSYPVVFRRWSNFHLWLLLSFCLLFLKPLGDGYDMNAPFGLNTPFLYSVCWPAVDVCVNCHLLQEVPLMRVERWTDLWV